MGRHDGRACTAAGRSGSTATLVPWARGRGRGRGRRRGARPGATLTARGATSIRRLRPLRSVHRLRPRRARGRDRRRATLAALAVEAVEGFGPTDAEPLAARRRRRSGAVAARRRSRPRPRGWWRPSRCSPPRAGSCFEARAVVLPGTCARPIRPRRRRSRRSTDAVERFAALGATVREAGRGAEPGRPGTAGRRARHRGSGPGALTKREREVAELAIEGLSAREIGAAPVHRGAHRRDPPRERLRQARRPLPGRARASRRPSTWTGDPDRPPGAPYRDLRTRSPYWPGCCGRPRSVPSMRKPPDPQGEEP